jgi:ribonuclease J
LVRTGANVIYEALADVHVSGHACQQELRLMHALTKPRFFMPVHGEYRHLHHHAMLAESMGMNPDNVRISTVGDIIELSQNRMSVAGTVPSGEVLVDGLGIGDVGAVVLRDRKHLSQDGMLIVVMAVDRNSGTVISGPDVISRGFVYVRESDELMQGAREAAKSVLTDFGRIDPSDWNRVKNDLRDAVSRYVYQSIKRSPMILPIIVTPEAREPNSGCLRLLSER